MSNLSKERLREIELELQGWTYSKMVSAEKFKAYNQSQDNRDRAILLCIREYTCAHCQQSGKGINFNRYHNDNCFLKGKSLSEFQSDIRTISSKKVSEKWGPSISFIKNYYTKMDIDSFDQRSVVGTTIHTCPHCRMSGKGNPFVGYHFNKCSFKGIDLRELNNDIFGGILSNSDIKNKYNLSHYHITIYKRSNSFQKKYNVSK